MEHKLIVVDYIPLDYSLIRVHINPRHKDPRLQKNIAAVRDIISADPLSIPLDPSIPAGTGN